VETRTFSVIFWTEVFEYALFHNYIFFVGGFISMCPAVSCYDLSALSKWTKMKMVMSADCSYYALAFVNNSAFIHYKMIKMI